jgi:acetolactate synthase small subunit
MNHSITFIADNKPGTLYKVTGLCMQKRVNIEKLVAGEFDHTQHISRARLDLSCTKEVAERIAEHIRHIVGVHTVTVKKAPQSRLK